MKKNLKHSLTLLMLVSTLTLTSCFTMTHVVGKGAQSNNTQIAKQWYALWGLVPINTVDTKAMAGDTPNYTVTTEMTFIDGLISGILNFVSINTRTVEVTK